MIPIINENGVNENEQFVETLADKELPAYDNALTFNVTYEDGSVHTIAVWRFIEMYLRITDKDGNFVPFRLKPAQIKLYKELCLQKMAGKPMRVNILKARQLGFSTVIAAIIFCLTAFRPNQKSCIVADKEENARNLFDKYVTFYEALPDFFKNALPKAKNNARELRFNYGKGQFSLIRILVQGEDSGRSYSFQNIHASECAAWKDLKKTLVSLLNTVSKSNIDSLIALETTAKGFNEYKSRWDKDFAKKTNYKALFFSWFEEAEYAIPYDGFPLFEWEKEMMKTYNLTLEQVAWYRSQFNDCDDDLGFTRQENPSNPIEAFMTSGNSVFNMELLIERKNEILDEYGEPKFLKQGFFVLEKEHSLDGMRIDIKSFKWQDTPRGEILIYKEPDATHPYVVVNDPAMGGEDYYATHVFDNYTGEQVAVYHKNKCDADEVAYQMYCLARYYCDAMITGETNTTAYLLQLCQKCGYKFIYQDQDIEELGTRFYNKLGYKTKTTNRQTMINMFALAFRDNPKIINDYETLCEMEAFQIVQSGTNSDKEKAVATGGKHDDLVMAACGFYLCRGLQRATPLQKAPNSTINGYDPFDWDNRHGNASQKEVYQKWD